MRTEGPMQALRVIMAAEASLVLTFGRGWFAAVVGLGLGLGLGLRLELEFECESAWAPEKVCVGDCIGFFRCSALAPWHCWQVT